MTAYSYGDVVLVPFPFTDLSRSKQRPAVVVSSPAFHRDHANVIVMAVTSHSRPAPVAGEAAISEWRKAGLLLPSLLKPVVATLEKGIIVRRLGRLDPKDRVALESAIREILGP